MNESPTSCPLVTIVALCYNQARYAVETLESIRQQTYPNIQIIITDDASSDESANVIESWVAEYDRSVTFIKHDTNKGLCSTLNEALTHCRGEYYQAVACDDLLLPNKIETQVEILQTHDVVMTFSDAYLMDENGKWWEAGGRFIQTSRLLHEPFPKNMYTFLLREKNIIPAPSVLVRASAVLKNGYDESLTFEDWDMWLRLARDHDFHFHNTPLAVYRVHSQNMTKTLRAVEHLTSRFRLLAKHADTEEKKKMLEPALRRIVMKAFLKSPRQSVEMVKMFNELYGGVGTLLKCSRLPFANRTVYRLLGGRLDP